MTSDPSKKLAALLKKLRHAYADTECAPCEEILELDRIATQFVYSMMLWETNASHARTACRKLAESFADANELRVAFDDEIAHAIGDKYPMGLERAGRLRAGLNDIYQRFHAVTLAPLAELGKRESRQQLDSLEGVPGFVAARVASICLGCHAIPVDERLRALLTDEGIADEVSNVESVQHWLERSIPAEEGPAVLLLLNHWSDEKGQAPRREAKPAPKPAASAAKRDAKKAEVAPAASKGGKKTVGRTTKGRGSNGEDKA